MPVDPELVALLVCPACHGDIEYKERRAVIVCTACGLRYPVRDNIPVMLVEEAERPSPSGGPADAATSGEPSAGAEGGEVAGEGGEESS